VVWTVEYDPSGRTLAAAFSRFVLVYDSATGALLRHKDAGGGGDVYALSASADGELLASGGAEGVVSLWSWALARKYHFTHGGGASVQALAFNPAVPGLLASASSLDCAVWSASAGALRAHALPGRAACAAWTPDGGTLAVGLADGPAAVSLRDATGAELGRIMRPGGGPIWDVVALPPAPGAPAASAPAASSSELAPCE